MTQIILHKPIDLDLRRQKRVVLDWPWVWWETRVYPDQDGYLMIQNSDGLDRHTTYRWTFGQDASRVVITDPPAMHLLQVMPRHEAVGFHPDMSDLIRIDTTPTYMTVRMVWHEPPGELETGEGGLLSYGAWRPLAARTCMIGDYRIETVNSRDVQDLADPRPMIFPHRLPPLQWSETPTIRDGENASPRRLGYTVPSAYDFMRYRAHHRARNDRQTPHPTQGDQTAATVRNTHHRRHQRRRDHPPNR